MIKPLTCGGCGVSFRGRSDAVYCSSACRQKAHRSRTARRIADMSERHAARTHGRRRTTRPNVAVTIERARNEQRRAQELCRDAVDMQRWAMAAQRLAGQRPVVRVVSATASPPWSGWADIARAVGVDS